MCVTYKTNTAAASTVAIQTSRGSVVLFTASFFSHRKSTTGQCVYGAVSVVPDDLTYKTLLKFRWSSSRRIQRGHRARNQVAPCYPKGIRDPQDCGVRTARSRQV